MEHEYTSLEIVGYAIAVGQLKAETLRAYFDGGEIIINNEKGITIYRATERQALIDLLGPYFQIAHKIM